MLQSPAQDTVYKVVHDDALKSAVRQAKSPEDACEIGSLQVAVAEFKDSLKKEFAEPAGAGSAGTAGSGDDPKPNPEARWGCSLLVMLLLFCWCMVWLVMLLVLAFLLLWQHQL